MVVEDTHRRAGDIVVAAVALAPLILADKVTALHFLFGLPLFIYYIRDFKNISSLGDRLIVSMVLSFIMLLFACYPTQLILNQFDDPPDWDIVLAILWFFTFLAIWIGRKKLFEHVNTRSEA